MAEIKVRAIEGYGCSCGFTTDDLGEFRRHLTSKGKVEKGKHKSLGRVNLQTGEVIMPPVKDRTTEQKKASVYGKRKTDGATETTKTTELSAAQQVKFVPRVFTCDYTPVMRAAQEAAIREWGWRSDMPLDNFLDTVLHIAFKDRGIILAGYIVEREDQNVS